MVLVAVVAVVSVVSARSVGSPATEEDWLMLGVSTAICEDAGCGACVFRKDAGVRGTIREDPAAVAEEDATDDEDAAREARSGGGDISIFTGSRGTEETAGDDDNLTSIVLTEDSCGRLRGFGGDAFAAVVDGLEMLEVGDGVGNVEEMVGVRVLGGNSLAASDKVLEGGAVGVAERIGARKEAGTASTDAGLWTSGITCIEVGLQGSGIEPGRTAGAGGVTALVDGKVEVEAWRGLVAGRTAERGGVKVLLDGKAEVEPSEGLLRGGVAALVDGRVELDGLERGMEVG